MLHKTVIAFAIALVLESTALSANAFARGGDFSGGGFGGVRRDHLAIGRGGGRGGCIAGEGEGRCSGRVSDLLPRFPMYERPDVWGRWGSYYGPMVHAP